MKLLTLLNFLSVKDTCKTCAITVGLGKGKVKHTFTVRLSKLKFKGVSWRKIRGVGLKTTKYKGPTSITITKILDFKGLFYRLIPKIFSNHNLEIIFYSF